MPAPSGKVPSKLSVDFSNVGDRSEGGAAAHVPEGDYLLQVLGCELRKKKDDDTSKYLSWKLGISKPDRYKGKGAVYHITTLKEEGLWSLRNFLEDLGFKVPKSAVDLPLAQIVQKKPIIGATLVDDEYNGKVKSKIAATFKKSAYEETGETDDEEEEDTDDTEDEDEEEEEAPAPVKKKAKETPAKTEDDDEDEDLDELELDDL